MKKKFLSLILFLCLLTLAGCSSSGKSMRTGNVSDDVIKFHGIEWLTEPKDVEKILKSDYGEGTYTVFTGKSTSPYTDNVYYAVYYGKNGKDDPLLWSIGGYGAKRIDMDFYSTDAGKTEYLYSVNVLYQSYSKSQFDDLKSKLGKLYTETDDFYSAYDSAVYYSDKNNNQIKLDYLHDSRTEIYHLTLKYECGDIIERLNNEKEEKTKEETRQQYPDL